MADLGTQLRKLRKGAGFTQDDIADMLGLTQTSINRYETNRGAPNPDTLLWYADYFDVSLDYIFGRTDSPSGKIYEYKPKMLKEKSKKNTEIKRFVDMCFDPDSSIYPRLKEVLVRMLEGDEEK